MTTNLGLILASILLVLLNGFFVAAEFAIVKLRRTRADALESISGWRGAVLARVHRNLDAYLSACQLGITLASLGLGWIGEPAFADLLEPLFTGLGIDNPQTVSTIAFLIAFMTLSYLHIVVGELAPKSLALRKTESVSLWTAIPLYAFYWCMLPVIWGLNRSAFWVLRQFNLDLASDTEDDYTIDEIKLILRTSLVDTKLSTGADWRALAQALGFGEAEVADIMRPMSEAIVLSRADSIEENMARVETHKLSRYPYVDAGGNIIGIVHLKDLLLPQRDLQRDALEKAAKPPLLVPPDLPASVLLQRFRLEGHHMAIVGFSAQRPVGFLTFDDMLSALMGGIRDEFRSSKTDWTRLEDGSLIVRGSLPIFTLEQTLGIDIEARGARTVNGLILQKLEMLPRLGQRIEFDRFDVLVEQMDGARILQLRVFPHDRAVQDDFQD